MYGTARIGVEEAVRSEHLHVRAQLDRVIAGPAAAPDEREVVRELKQRLASALRELRAAAQGERALHDDVGECGIPHVKIGIGVTGLDIQLVEAIRSRHPLVGRDEVVITDERGVAVVVPQGTVLTRSRRRPAEGVSRGQRLRERERAVDPSGDVVAVEVLGPHLADQSAGAENRQRNAVGGQKRTRHIRERCRRGRHDLRRLGLRVLTDAFIGEEVVPAVAPQRATGVAAEHRQPIRRLGDLAARVRAA